MSVGWKFYDKDITAINNFSKEDLESRACYYDYNKEYKPTYNMYIRMNTYSWCSELISKFKFKNIKIKEIKTISRKIIEKNDWGGPIYEEVEGGPLRESLFKISLSDKYTPMSKYIITYLVANMVRMFSKEEGFPNALKYIKGDIFEYLVELNSSCGRYNTNHILTTNYGEFDKECLYFLDDVKKVNSLFEEGKEFKTSNTGNYYAYSNVMTLQVGMRLSQTNLFSIIYDHLKE